ncbi:extracellular nuclease [Salinisphaera dokdonensis CL-ES53]|uniref:Extracellular nuclease n=2 Tax=Salinisphaera TaxID=180541 RepID=A0ABV2B521_9GAMM
MSADDGMCTLREAITAANSDTATGGCTAGAAADMIVFGEGVAGSTITLTAGELPAITDELTIGMDEMSGATVDANLQSRILTNQATLTLNGMTLINGMVEGSGDDGANSRSGGAILNDAGGVLTVNGGAMNNNTSDRAGGAIEEVSGAAAGTTAVTLNGVDFSGNDAGMNPGNGGVLHVTGTGDVVVDGGTFDGNTAVEGGALWNNGGTMSVTGAMFTANTATGGTADAGDDTAQGGGALFGNTAGGTLDVADSTFDGNSAMGDVSSGGAIFVNNGAILLLSNSTLTNNTANRAGGAIELRGGSSATLEQVDAEMNTANTTAGGGGGNGGVVHVTGDATVDVSGGVYARNTAIEGGAFWNNQGTMTLDGVNVVANDATGADASQGGGGIFAETNDAGVDSGTLVVMNSRIVGNTASGAAGSGGGILVSAGATANITDTRISGNTANRAGGGIESASGTVTMTGVTLGGTSSADGNDAGASPGNGGGLHVGGTGSTTITRSTVGYNQAVEGGGLWNNTGSTMTLDTSTVSNNTATRGAGVYLNGDASAITLDFASVTNNNGTGIESGDTTNGNVVALGSNLVANNTTADIGSNVIVDDEEAVLTGEVSVDTYRLFGGPTATQPLPAGSTALDTNADCGTPEDSATDQRGAERPSSAMGETDAGNCDSGAYELTDDPVVTVTSNGPAAVTVSSDDSLTAVLGITLANDSDAAVTVGGFSGYIERDASLPAGFDLRDAELSVYADDNGNGIYEMGEGAVGTATPLDDNGTTFTVALDGGAGVSIPANDSMSYVLVASQSAGDVEMMTGNESTLLTPKALYAGGAALLLLSLVSVGGLRRRTQLLLIVAALALTLTACSDSDSDDDGVNIGGGDNDAGDMMAFGELRVVLQTLNASGDVDTDLVIGDGLPVRGPVVSFAAASDSDGDSDDDSEG